MFGCVDRSNIHRLSLCWCLGSATRPPRTHLDLSNSNGKSCRGCQQSCWVYLWKGELAFSWYRVPAISLSLEQPFRGFPRRFPLAKLFYAMQSGFVVVPYVRWTCNEDPSKSAGIVLLTDSRIPCFFCLHSRLFLSTVDIVTQWRLYGALRLNDMLTCWKR